MKKNIFILKKKIIVKDYKLLIMFEVRKLEFD